MAIFIGFGMSTVSTLQHMCLQTFKRSKNFHAKFKFNICESV